MYKMAQQNLERRLEMHLEVPFALYAPGQCTVTPNTKHRQALTSAMPA